MIRQPPREDEATSWLWVGWWVLIIYVTVPLARLIQQWVAEHADPMLFFWFVIGWVVLGVAASAAFLARQPDRPPLRAWLVLAAVAGAYAGFSWQLRGNPEEAVHFVQYGVLGALVFRALTHRVRDPSIYVLAALVTALFGMLDEGLQWIVPRRFFDFRDIGINVLAGILMQVALAFGLRPAYIRRVFVPRGWRLACRMAIALLILLLAYLSNTSRMQSSLARLFDGYRPPDEVMVEYGYRIDLPEQGLTFFSRLPLDEVQAQDRARWHEVVPALNEHWREDRYIDFLKRYPSFVDPFLHELRIHQFRRDRYRFHAFSAPHLSDERRENATVSVREDQILRFLYPNIYANALLGWPAQELDHMTSLADLGEPYVSAVSAGIITSMSQTTARALVLTAIALVLLLDWRLGRWRTQTTTAAPKA